MKTPVLGSINTKGKRVTKKGKRDEICPDWRKNLSPPGIPPFIKQDLLLFRLFPPQAAGEERGGHRLGQGQEIGDPCPLRESAVRGGKHGVGHDAHGGEQAQSPEIGRASCRERV